MALKIEAEFPEELAFLFQPHRYKIVYGGRSGLKSWSFARALLIMGVSKKLRVLCTREVQRSIKDSVHALLKDQIEILGLGSHYLVTDVGIRGKNGTNFIFAGLSTQTVESIKSYEGVDVVWIEEAQVVRKRSWDILIPTIRKAGSEIWISFNPELETDETYVRFIKNTPPDAVVKFTTFRDNPWHTELLEKERLHCKKTDPDGYINIWEGKCLPAVPGAIYFKQMQQMDEEHRICNVDYDPILKVHVVVDLGGEDTMAIGMIQKDPGAIRIIDYIEGTHDKLSDYSIELKKRKYNWGKMWLPHDAYSKNPQTGFSSAQIFSRLGWNVPDKETILESAKSVEEGIKATRQILFPKLYIDKTKCERLVECLKRYRRRINQQTGAPGEPLHDEFSHGADMVRYIAVNSHNMHNAMSGGHFAPTRDIRAREA